MVFVNLFYKCSIFLDLSLYVICVFPRDLENVVELVLSLISSILSMVVLSPVV